MASKLDISNTFDLTFYIFTLYNNVIMSMAMGLGLRKIKCRGGRNNG
jgi:hypothetical protein